MAGVKETKEVLTALAEIGEAVEKAKADGKLDVNDVAYFVGAAVTLPSALTGLDQVAAELKDLDAAEAQELSDHVKAELDLADDKLEGVIEKGLDVGVKLAEFLSALKAAKSS